MNILKNLDEKKNTLIESASRTYIVDGYPTESCETQHDLKDYYVYPNYVIHDNENNNNPSVDISCSRTQFSSQMKNPKVFIRRIDNKHILDNKTYNVLNSSYSKTYNVLNSSYNKNVNPYIIPSKDYFNRIKLRDSNYDIRTYTNGETNKEYSLDKTNDKKYSYCIDEYKNPLKGNLLSENNPQIDVPLCVQEASKKDGGYNIMVSTNPVNQDKLYYNYLLQDKIFDINPRVFLNFIYILFRYIYKIFKLAIEKMKKELSIGEVNFDSDIQPYNELNISCETFRNKYGDVLIESHNKDYLTYFEELSDSRNIFTKLWDIINNWIDGKENNEIEIIKRKKKKKKNQDVYYQMEEFPKDEYGKIELPEFKDVDRKNQ